MDKQDEYNGKRGTSKAAMKIKNVFRRNKAFTCSKSTMETPEQCVKSVQS